MIKQRVLFVCTENSCRSQMAEGLLRHYGADRFEGEGIGFHEVLRRAFVAIAAAEPA